MSAYMRDWIGPLAERELARALEGKALVANAFNSHSEPGKLIVHLIEGKSIQINEFIGHSPEYVLWVSDSFTRIRAVFTKKATESFQKKYKRPFSKGTLGAVVGITEYFLSPPSKRVTLKVESFILQGGEGSGNFGSPIRVEELETIKNLISPLSGQFDSSSCSCTDSPLDSLSPVRSQAGSYAESLSSSEDAIQLAFATQAPHDVPKAIYTQSHKVTNQSLPRSVAFLDLLGANQPINGVGYTHGDNLKGEGEILVSQEGNFSGNLRPNVGASTPPILISTIDQILVNRKSSPQSNTQDPLNISTGPSQHHTHESAIPAPTDRNTTRAAPDNGFATSNDATESEMENWGPISDYNLKPRKPAVPEPCYKEAPDYRIDESINYWKGLTRIPRKYVQIPKDQQKLLGRDDSWCSQKPNDQRIARVVPDEVLTELKAFYSRKSHSETDAHGQNDNLSGDPQRASEARSETDSDGGLSRPLEDLKAPSVGASQNKISSQYKSGHRHSSPYSCPHTGTQRTLLQAQSTSSDDCLTHPENERESSQASVRGRYIDPYSFFKAQGLQEDKLPEADLNLARMSTLDDAFEHSSSPLEMEVDVPFGLPSTAERPQLDLQVERTPYEKSGNRLLPSLPGNLSETRFTQPTQKSSARDEPESMSSDPIIPATFDGEIVTNLEDSNELTPHFYPSDVGDYAPSSIAQAEETSVQHQLPVEFNIFSQKSGYAEISTRTTDSPGLFLNHRMSGGPEHRSPRANHINIVNRSSPRTSGHMSIPDTQIVALPALQSLNELRGGEGTSVLKRNISNASESPELAHKRRRAIQSALFSSSQDDEPMVNPSEMARANRRDFLRQFSIMQDVSNEEPKPSDQAATLSNTTASEEVRPDKIQNHNICTNTPFKQKRVPLFSSPDEGLDVTNQFHKATDKETHDANDADSKHDEAYSDLICITDLTFHNFEALAGRSHKPDLDDIVTKSKSLSSKEITLEKPMNLFEKFCFTYPTYTESMNTFIKSCVYLKQQRDKKKAPHPILWDDFIRLFSTEYPLYVRDCQLTSQAPMNGIAYYNNFVDEPLFSERVVMIASLPEALLLDPKMTSSSQELIQQASCSYQSQLSIPDSLQGLLETNEHPELSEISSEHVSAYPVPNQTSSRGVCISKSSKEKYILKDQANRVYLTAENGNDPRNPFFETPSQLLIQNSRYPIQADIFEISSLPARMIGATIIEQNGSDKTDLSPTTILKHNMRQLPWSSTPSIRPSPQNVSKKGQEAESCLESSSPAFTRKALALHRTERKPGNQPLDLQRSRQGSPILGSNVLELMSTTGSREGSGRPRPIISKTAASEHRVFKTPSLPIDKHLGRKTKSMPGLWQTSECNFEKQTSDGSSAMEPKKTLRAFVPAPVASFKEFSKAFMPRRKRMSSLLSRSPALTSVVTPPIKKQLAKQDHYPPTEPETQAWTF